MELTAVVEQGASSYLVRLIRLHFDNLPGGLLNVRGRVTDGLRERLADSLLQAKTQNEEAYAAVSGSPQ